MGERFTTARIVQGGERFEILVHPQNALDYRLRRNVEISQVLGVDLIFTDASKGMKASEDKLLKTFMTTDVFAIAKRILDQGELQLTTEQRRNLVEEKRKQIVAFISKHCTDPRTGMPHPPLRVEQAMSQIRFSIDPFKDAEEQSKEAIQLLRPILPLKIEQVRIAVKIPPEYAGKAYGSVKNYGVITREEWQADGSWIAVVEMPAGLQGPFFEKLGKLTQGNLQTKILR